MYVNANTFLAEAPRGILTCPPFTSRVVIDNRIDVFAQYALLRMLKGDPAAKADAQGMLCAVKTGQLAGIYKEDERVPALRARKLGTSWWEVIPANEDATILSDPESPVLGAPIIVFRDSIRSNSSRLDPSLRKAYRLFQTFLSITPFECEQQQKTTNESEQLKQIGALPDEKQCKAPKQSSCSSMKKLDKAVCEFKARLNNGWLVCYGQSYWSLLARDALEQEKRKFEKCDASEKTKKGRGRKLYCELKSAYLSAKKGEPRRPKSPQHLWEWFLREKNRELTWCDQQALESVSRNQCSDTVAFVMTIFALEGFGHGESNLRVFPEAFIREADDGDGKRDCQITGKNMKSVVSKLKSTIDRGHPVRAGVYPPRGRPCGVKLFMRSLNHYVLIIGHDGANRFVYWNTGQGPEGSEYGSRFGYLDFDGKRLVSPAGRYQVVYLDSIQPKSITCPR